MSQHEIVVTGASGFIARALLQRLEAYDGPVTALTRHADLRLPGVVRLVRGADYSAFRPSRNAVLVHLGEPSHISSVDRQGSAHVDAMTRQVAALLACGYRHVVYASSATVYGDDSDVAHVPGDPLMTGRKVYADAKIAVEDVVRRRGGTVARVTNIYGPGMSDANIFSDVLRQLSSDGPIAIRETSPVREYLWIGDLAECLMLMATRPAAGIFNISSGEAVSCQRLVELVLQVAGQPDREIVSTQPARHSVLKLDIADTTRTFGWAPRTDLRSGIAALLAGQ